MILVKVVRPDFIPEKIKMPVYVYQGDDPEKAIDMAVSFQKDNPVAFLGSREVEIVRVLDTELITTVELPKEDSTKMLDGMLDMLNRLSESSKE